MIIYWSMIAFVAICAIGNSLMRQTVNATGSCGQSKFWVYLPMIYIIFWTGIRTGFVDTAAYIYTYKGIPADSFRSIFEYASGCEKDQLFYFASGVFKLIFGSNYHYWLFAIALLSGLCVVRQIYRYSASPFFSLFLFMTMNIFTWLMNGIRQFIVISILFALSDWLIDRKKRWKYILVVLLLSFVHSSALFALPFIIVVMFSKPWDRRMLLMSVVIAVAIAYAGRFINILTETVAQDYAETIGESTGSSIIRTIVAFVPVGIAFIKRRMIHAKGDKYLDLCINMSVVSALLYALSSFTNGILVGRMPMYFEVYNLLLLPWLIKRCFKFWERQMLTFACVVCYLVFFVYQGTVAGNFYYASDLTGFLGSNIW